MNCPLCNKKAGTERGMIKHITGTKAYGGHELTEGQATLLAHSGRLTAEEEKRLAAEYPDSAIAKRLSRE